MQPPIQIGQQATVEVTVTEDMCPAFDGVVVHRVYSTWTMAHHMEIAARTLLVPHLEAHEEGIGAHLSIDHVAPAPLGERVRIIATAEEVDATTIACRLEAYHVRPDRERIIGRGRQVQRVLPRTTLDALIRRATDD
ncbi:MAG: thioesterase family protein [Phycisphaerales bacterium]